MKVSNDIVTIADTQVVPSAPLEHLHAVARYIWKHKPRLIVHIGDHWDFESLNYYASALEKEGRRLKDDLVSGAKALDIIKDYIDMKNSSCKQKKYKPEMHFVMGNHENRLNRYIESHPELSGFINLREMIERAGWVVHEFLEPFWFDDICFNHFMPNPESSRPVGGSIMNKMNKFPHSFVHGHQQKFQFERRQNMLGKPHFGVCAGSFYIHDESYRGANNTEIRGFTHLKQFTNRYDYSDYDVEFVSLERLLVDYCE